MALEWEKEGKTERKGTEERGVGFQLLSQPWKQKQPRWKKKRERKNKTNREEKRERERQRDIVGIAILFFKGGKKENWNANRPHNKMTSIFGRLDTEFPANSHSLFISLSLCLISPFFLLLSVFSVFAGNVVNSTLCLPVREILKQTMPTIYYTIYYIAIELSLEENSK